MKNKTLRIGIAGLGAVGLDVAHRLIDGVAVPPKPRRPTRPTRASKVRRVEGKTRRGRIKSLRGRVSED